MGGQQVSPQIVKRVHTFLKEEADLENVVTASRTYMAEILGISVTSIKLAEKVLENTGSIKRAGHVGRGNINVYEIVE